MKKFILIALSIIFTKSILAQAIITQAHVPSIGEELYLIRASSVPAGFSFDKSGTNVTWDFTNLTPGTTIDTTFIINPAGTPHASKFQAADIAHYASNDPTIFYWDSQVSSVSILGIYGDLLNNGNKISILLNPATVYYTFPYTFASTVSSTSNAEYKDKGSAFNQPTFDSIRFKRNIVQTKEAIAWGTLIINTGTFDETLLEKVVVVNRDSTWGKAAFPPTWVLLQTATSTDSVHNWVTGNSMFPYAQVNYSNGSISNIKYHHTDITTEINMPDQSLKTRIYPNPASEQLYIATSINEPLTMEVIDLKGRIVLKERINTNLISVNIKTIEPGIYFCRLYSGNGAFEIHKFVVRK
jgi:hypothetical protein